MTTAFEIISKARATMILKNPFYGILALNLEPIEDPSVLTAATNGTSLYYAPKYIKELYDKGGLPLVVSLVCHEVMHCALGHLWRQDSRSMIRWNHACDYAINALLEDAGFTLDPNWLLDSRFYNISAEEIYTRLEDNLPPGMPGDNFAGSHDRWNKAGSDQKSESDWIVNVAAAAEATQHGSLPEYLKRRILEFTEPKIPWQDILADIVQRNGKDYLWSSPDRRFIGEDIYLPGIANVDYGNQIHNAEIAIGIDTSGSISKPELIRFLSEACGILSPPSLAHFFVCDAMVHNMTSIVVDEDFSESDVRMRVAQVELKGGGGTDFRPVFKTIKDKNIAPDALIFFTDGYGYYPEEAPSYPVIWAVTNKGKIDVNWGIRTKL
jgi:predicted metal-dependent peptidase